MRLAIIIVGLLLELIAIGWMSGQEKADVPYAIPMLIIGLFMVIGGAVMFRKGITNDSDK